MSFNIITGGGTSTSQGGGGATPDGTPIISTSRKGVASTWTPTGVAATDFDVLIAADPVDERTVLADGGVMTGNILTTFAMPRGPLATLSAGPKFRNAATAVSGGALTYPTDGCIPQDQWTIDCWAYPVSADASTLTNAYLFSIFVGTQSLSVLASSGFLQAVLTNNEASVTGGALHQHKSQIALVSGDMPATTWTKVSVTYNGTVLALMLGDNTKNGVVAGDATFPTSQLRTWGGDPWHGEGMVVGGAALSSTTGQITVTPPTVSRYARTFNAQVVAKPATITVDATTSLGTYPKAVAGVVNHYSGYTNNDTDNAALRDPQLAIMTAAGVPALRMTEQHLQAVPAAISGNAVTSIDFTKFDNNWGRLAATGAELRFMIGYSPAIFNANQYGPPSNNAAYADWVSKVLAHIVAQGWNLTGLSFWNEPSNNWLAGGTVAQFNALWLAVAQRLQTDFPSGVGPNNVVLGGPDALWTVGGGTDKAYQTGIIDTAQANSLPLGALYLHYYGTTFFGLQQMIADMKAYAAAAGFGSVPVNVSEWNYTLASSDRQPAALASQEPRRITAYNAAFVHSFVGEMVAAGCKYGAFYRMGENSNGTENNELLLSADAVPQPVPAMGAFELLWKHSGNRITTTANWPNLRVLASLSSGSVITLTYSSMRTWRSKDVLTSRLEWTGLPATFTWKHWKVDYNNGADGRPILVASGTQANLPLAITHTAVGMGCIQVKP